MTGFERGSIFSTLSRERQIEFRKWLQKHSTDSRFFEAQLSCRPVARRKSNSEV